MEIIVYILFIAMWWAAAISLIANMQEYVLDLPIWQRVVAFGLAIIGAPFTLIGQGFTILFEALMPGWGEDDDDDNGFKY